MMILLLNVMMISLLILITMFSKTLKKDKEKLSLFECGFNSFCSSHNPFSIQFFKILLIFLLFDSEIVLIIPIPLFFYLNYISMIFMVTMMIMVILGLFYEWMEGSLEWIKF